MKDDRPIVVTMGDPAGIGGEIALMAWRDHRTALPPFYLLDDPDRLNRLSDAAGIECPIAEIDHTDDTAQMFKDALPVMRLSRPVHALPGDDSTADTQHGLAPAVLDLGQPKRANRDIEGSIAIGPNPPDGPAIRAAGC